MLPVVVISSGDSSPAQAVMAEVDRIDEEDPVRIAADIARQVARGDLANLTDLVVATSEHFSDAIVSAGLAGYLDACPRPGGASCRRTATVVTPADELAEVTAEVISDSGVPASRITLLGGPAAVSEVVRDRIASTAGWDGEGENPVRRVAGATRYDTAAAIAAHLVELAGESGGDPLDDSYRTVVVATGANPADALAASALAYGGGHVLLLASGGEVPPALDAAVAALDANCAILVGGSTALSDVVEDHLERTVASTGRGACGAERIAGRDRHDTAARVADRVADQFGGPSSIVVTNPHGAGLAWTAAPLTRTRTSLLFTRDGELPEPTRDWITARPGIARVIVVGATRDIDRTVVAEVTESTFTRPLLPPPTALAPAPLSLSYESTAFDTNQTSQTLGPTVTGGTGPFSFALTGGSLPVGVTFDPTTGAFTGPGAWNFGAVVTVSAGTAHTCGVLADTTAVALESDAVGGPPVAGDRRDVAEVAEVDHLLAVLPRRGVHPLLDLERLETEDAAVAVEHVDELPLGRIQAERGLAVVDVDRLGELLLDEPPLPRRHLLLDAHQVRAPSEHVADLVGAELEQQPEHVLETGLLAARKVALLARRRVGRAVVGVGTQALAGLADEAGVGGGERRLERGHAEQERVCGLGRDHVKRRTAKAVLRKHLERGLEDGFAILPLDTRARFLLSHAPI